LNLEAFLGGLIAGYGVAIPLGPIAVLIMTLGFQRGFKTAASGAAGAATADLLYAAVAALAGTTIGDMLMPYAKPVRFLSGAILIIIGLRLLRNSERTRSGSENDSVPQSHNGFRAYGLILGLTLTNPLTVLYFTALILGLQSNILATTADKMFFVGGVSISSFSWQLTLATIGTLIGKKISQRAKIITSVLAALLIIGLGLVILLQLS